MRNIVRLHRVISANPEKVYRAFLEPDALAQWLPPDGFVCTVHELDARTGGRHRASFRTLPPGAAILSAANTSHWSRTSG